MGKIGLCQNTTKLIDAVCNLTIIGSDDSLSPGRRQAIIWTNAGILLIWTLGTNFSETLTEIHTFSFEKMYLKMSSAKWRQRCLGLNVLRVWRNILRAFTKNCFYNHNKTLCLVHGISSGKCDHAKNRATPPLPWPNHEATLFISSSVRVSYKHMIDVFRVTRTDMVLYLLSLEAEPRILCANSL